MLDMKYYRSHMKKLLRKMKDSCLICERRLDCERYMDWLVEPSPTLDLPEMCGDYERERVSEDNNE